jgi:uncharacterized protein (DUF362 family)
MRRRDFLKSSFTVSTGLLVSTPFNTFCNNGVSFSKSKVVISKNSHIQKSMGSVDSDQMLKSLDNGMQSLFAADHPLTAWEQVVKPGEVIGLKVNCLSGRGATHTTLVQAISERLQAVGIRSEDIVIWDRFNSDLEDGGYRLNHRGRGVRCFGNDTLGFESDFEIFKSAASLLCKTLTRVCDAVINLPVLKDHGIAGITISLKNMFGAIHNPNKYHLNVGNPYIPDVFSLPSIKKKVRLTICDAIVAQYEGGPSYMPHWSWPLNSLILSRDPVALDYTGWQIIEAERKKRGFEPLKAVNREPEYITTAADPQHKLGTNNPDQIELVRV